MSRFREALTPTAETSVLDIGGYPGNWRESGVRSPVTILNVHPVTYTPLSDDPPMSTLVGDGCALDFPDGSFDIVFSNSVIEHVGTWERQQAFARQCRRVGHSLWVQTPARSFFMEPHLLTPFIHYLPKPLQRRLIRNFSVHGLLARPTPGQVEEFLAEVRLLSLAEMRALFPDCEILREKFLGLTKSYIAVRQGASASRPDLP